MKGNPSNRWASGSEAAAATRLTASAFQRANAGHFLTWRTETGTFAALMRAFAQSIEATLHLDVHELAPGELASSLPRVLASCDELSFDDRAEALAYAALHLLDRYGRVDQVLQHLVRIGRLPLRVRGARVLEVGSGPAPAVYSTRDFYSSLRNWPGANQFLLGPVTVVDTLDRGQAWDPILHRLSEGLLSNNPDLVESGQLPFRRSIEELAGFNAWERHHRAVRRKADEILREYEAVDEWISEGAARQLAYDEGVPEPSAYDLIFLPYFLTQDSVTEQHHLELSRLAGSLTPGGVLIVMGGTSPKYQDIYMSVRTIAAEARLRDVSPIDAFQADADPEALSLVAAHVQRNVKSALRNCPSQIATRVERDLPQDLVNAEIRFRLPQFRALVFVRQAPPRRGNKKTTVKNRRSRG